MKNVMLQKIMRQIKKECDKLYDALEEDEKDDINSFEDCIKSF